MHIPYRDPIRVLFWGIWDWTPHVFLLPFGLFNLASHFGPSQLRGHGKPRWPVSPGLPFLLVQMGNGQGRLGFEDFNLKLGHFNDVQFHSIHGTWHFGLHLVDLFDKCNMPVWWILCEQAFGCWVGWFVFAHGGEWLGLVGASTSRPCQKSWEKSRCYCGWNPATSLVEVASISHNV